LERAVFSRRLADPESKGGYLDEWRQEILAEVKGRPPDLQRLAPHFGPSLSNSTIVRPEMPFEEFNQRHTGAPVSDCFEPCPKCSSVRQRPILLNAYQFFYR
jgi:hypothetical protein